MDWNLFYDLSKITARKIKESGYEPDFVVGLARGGWVLSRVLCDFLGIKDLVSLKVEHWGVTATPDGKAQLRFPFDIDLTGRKVLVVDDITDTGESMKVATDYIATMNPSESRSATLRHITGSAFTPDYYGDEITWRWVIFPWNYVEDMCTLVTKVSEGCEDIPEIRGKLKENFKIEVSLESVAEIIAEIECRRKCKTQEN